MKHMRRWTALGGMAFAVSSTMALRLSSHDLTDAEGREVVGRIRGIVRVDGMVTYNGPQPVAKPIDMSADAYCTEANTGTQVMEEQFVLGAGGGVGNVIVYIKEGLQAGSFPASEEAVLLDQQNCQYAPHMVALRTGQPLVIRNSDQTLHNVHVFPQNNRGFNIGQPLRGLQARRQFPNPEVSISVRCDVHGWMQAYVAVFEHPFFAVTGGDGHFQLDDLPPGEYVLEAWHESLGVRVETVTVAPGVDAQVSFVFGG